MEDLKILQERSCSKIQVLRQGLTLWIQGMRVRAPKIGRSLHHNICWRRWHCSQWRRRHQGCRPSLKRRQRRSYGSWPSQKFRRRPPLFQKVLKKWYSIQKIEYIFSLSGGRSDPKVIKITFLFCFLSLPLLNFDIWFWFQSVRQSFSLSLFFFPFSVLRSDCIELDFKEISYFVKG